MALAPDWALLPPELINRIAGCLLATNDVDHYMDLRAVCGSWRSATDDPKSSPDPRFRPRLWVAVDEVFQSSARLLVNTATGRVLRKDLPQVHRNHLDSDYDYYLVAATHGGFFVLADRKPPHAALVLNPFTGSLLRFAAPLPSGTRTVVDVAAVVGSSTPTLVLFCDADRKLYTADPHAESFSVYDTTHYNYNYSLTRLAILGGIYAGCQHGLAAPPLLSDDITIKVLDLLSSFSIHPSETLALYPYPQSERARHTDRCFLVESAGEMLIIFKLQQQPARMEVFRVDAGRNVVEPVSSIGSRAIFLGYRTCVSVDADKFPSIDANCVYYVVKGVDDVVKGVDGYLAEVYVYDLKDGKEERVSGAIDCLNRNFLWRAHPPFTIIQLLSSYTINAPISGMEFAGVPDDLVFDEEACDLSSIFDEEACDLSSILEDIIFDDY